MRLSELAEAARALGRAAFLERFPDPLLLSEGGEDEDGPSDFSTSDYPRLGEPGSDATKRESLPFTGEETDAEIDVRPVAHATQAAPAGESKGNLIPIRKSSRNPFGQMVTVGRTPNNDVVVRDAGVSKFHAYFTRRGETWRLHDQGSTNGTFVGDARVDEKGVALTTGDRVGFGHRLRFRFYLPEALFTAIASRKGVAG